MSSHKNYFKKTALQNLLGMTALGLLAFQPATAAELGYVTDSSGNVVRTSYGECWKALDGMQKKLPECGDEVDADGDGVTDDLDQCPKTAAGTKVDAKGCALDSDGDGVADDMDRCPGTPAGAKVDAKGCVLDSDGDGVPDGQDQCSGTPAGAAVDANGCATDTDGDGIADYKDRCPSTSAGTKVDTSGCATVIGTVFTANLVGDEFDSNSAVLKPAMKDALDALADRIAKAKSVTSISIVGHTDSMGETSYNQSLSERRAQATADYLTSRGVASSLITTSGAGESSPVADNSTSKGRAENRRTEVRVK